MQKPGTEISHKILPHHVFQLQCILDSLTVSRGWSVSLLKGHVMRAPPSEFRPRRDVDLFVDRENKKQVSGFINSVDVIRQFFEKDGAVHGDMSRHEANYNLLEQIQYDFINWLGETKYAHPTGLTGIPPSRFASSNANGLWEFSPFLCGAGLAEALVESFQWSWVVMETIPESTLLMHLHNALVRKGYITKPIGLYVAFESIFAKSFFREGKVPADQFDHHLLMALAGPDLRRPWYRPKENILERAAKLKKKTYLMACQQAGWNPDRIDDHDIPVASFLGGWRMMHTKHTADPTTGELRLEDTDLVKRLRAQGLSDKELLHWNRLGSQESGRNKAIPEALLQAMVPEGHSTGPSLGHASMNSYSELTNQELLDFLKKDIYDDICGKSPLSSLNYVWVMCRFFTTFQIMEEELEKVRNPLYVQVYEKDPNWKASKRVGLVYLALKNDDKVVLRAMADAFEMFRLGFMNHIYWDDLDTDYSLEEKTKSGREEDEEGPDQCCVM